jgi:hypothetical protein
MKIHVLVKYDDQGNLTGIHGASTEEDQIAEVWESAGGNYVTVNTDELPLRDAVEIHDPSDGNTPE